MPQPFPKRSRTSLFLVLTFFTFYLCLSTSSGEDVTHRETDATLPNLTARQNRDRSRTATTSGVETSLTDSQTSVPVIEDRRRPVGQSEEHREIETIMFRMFEDHLLANLEFETLPRPVNASQPTVPDYMFRLYDHLKVDTGQDKQFRMPFSSSQDETDENFQETIRGYHAISENWQRHGRGYLVFNTTSQPMKENITHAELVLYICPSSANEKSNDNSRNSSKPEDDLPSSTSQYINITVTMATKRRRRHSRIHLRVPVESNRSCLPINITKMVQRSFVQRQTILNFSIETSNRRHQSVRLPCPCSRSEDENHPLLVIYENVFPFPEGRDYNNYRSKRGASTEQNATAGQIPTMDDDTLRMIDTREVANSTYLAENSTNATDPVSATPPRFATSSVGNETSSNFTTSYPVNCHLRRWYVNFAEMRWQHVIINPLGYYANYCWGLCPDALLTVNATTNALMRAMHLLLQRPDLNLPKPCCSPARMAPLTILYYSKYNVTIANRLNQMVAVECACL